MATVKQILDRKGRQVSTITADKSVFEALRLMGEKEIGALAVVEGEALVGILSERDYPRKVVLKGKTTRDARRCDHEFAGDLRHARAERRRMHDDHDGAAHPPSARAGAWEIGRHDFTGRSRQIHHRGTAVYHRPVENYIAR